jgi:hypothetical protein
LKNSAGKAFTAALKKRRCQVERILRRAKGGGGISRPVRQPRKTRGRKRRQGYPRIFWPIALDCLTRSYAFLAKASLKDAAAAMGARLAVFSAVESAFLPEAFWNG